MNHLKWLGHSGTIMEIQRSLHQDSTFCDVTLSSKGKTVRAHRFILVSCSDYFREMLQGVPDREEATIICPDIHENILENIMSFIYVGEVSVNSSNLSEFLESINLLGIKSAISFECHVNKTKISKGFAGASEELKQETKENETQNPHEDEASANCAAKEFEYLEVYNGDDKIDQYAIEQMETGCNEANTDYILQENENSFTLPEDKHDSEVVETKHTQTAEYTENILTEEAIIQEKDEFGLRETPTTAKLNKIKTSAGTAVAATSRIGLNDPLSRHEAFENAVNAVVQNGMSLQKAAIKFNISKTVLWRRVKKNSAYKIEREHPMISAAIEKLEKGESLKNVSQTLNIPISTLHRHKVRLLQEGRLPDHIQVKRRDSKDNLKLRLAKAIEECRRGMSQNQASTIFGVPKSTLWRHVQKKNIKLVKTETVEEISLSD